MDLQCAFNAFYTYSQPRLVNDTGFSADIAATAMKNPALIMRRNAIQDQILAVSEKACNNFKISINDRITKANFSFGSIATTLSGLGAVFTDPATARALSGASAIVSGVRAEYNESYLQSLTVQVITAGIDARRAEIRDEINGRRFGEASASEVGRVSLLAPRPYLALSPYDRSDEDLRRNSNLISELDANLRGATQELFNAKKLLTDLEANILGATDQERIDLQNRKKIQDKVIVDLEARIATLDSELKRVREYAKADDNDDIGADDNVFSDIVGQVPLSQYSAEMAIHDAMKYHAACTIPVGLEKAADSVEQLRNPGAETLQRAINTMNLLQDAMNQNSKLRSRSTIDQIENDIKFLDAQKRYREQLEKDDD
ncbi:MAG: hypothetical protein AAF224_03200 [Pseudomonadota bacterium]